MKQVAAFTLFCWLFYASLGANLACMEALGPQRSGVKLAVCTAAGFFAWPLLSAHDSVKKALRRYPWRG